MQTSEVFNHAKNLKLYSWEQKFGDKISELYNKEMGTKRNMMSFNGVNMCIQELINNFLPLCVFSVYVYNGNEMSMSQITLVSMMLQRVKGASRRASHVYEMFLELTTSMKNLHKFFTNDEVQASIINSTKNDESYSLKLKGNFSWGFEKAEKDKDGKEKEQDEKKDYKKEEEKKEDKKEEEKKEDNKEEEKKEKTSSLDSIMTLKDIDLDIKKGEFVIIVGKVGAGKTSLLNSITGEMLYVPDSEIKFAGGFEKQLKKEELEGIRASLFDMKIKEGEEPIKINGEISYVEQQPWT